MCIRDSPKYSFKYKPFEWLAFRGAYNTGFKVPSFNQLFNGISEVPYPGTDLPDPASCPSRVANTSVPGCEPLNRPVELFGGNPALKPETATQKSFGFVYSPMQWFNMSVDWWEIERENTIQSARRDYLLQYYELFQANWIRDASGQLESLDRRYINSGGSLMRGLELDANLRGELAGGHWNVNLNGSLITTFQTKALEVLPYSANQVGNYVRYYNLPIRWKHSLNFNYARGNWSHNLTQLHRDGYLDERPASYPGYIPAGWNPRVAPYRIWNYSVTWTGIENLKLGLGVKNLLDTDPPFTAHHNDFAAGAAWEPRIADPRGRAYTLMVEYKFWCCLLYTSPSPRD